MYLGITQEMEIVVMNKIDPLLILVLALGVFGIITTEMGIVGVLPQVTQKFNISASQAGWLVSIVALVWSARKLRSGSRGRRRHSRVALICA